jgi:hypothetical protein
MSNREGAAPAGTGNGLTLTERTPTVIAEPCALKYVRVLKRLLEGPLHRFEAEKFPVSDHCLPSTISELRKRGIDFNVKTIRLPGYAGQGANVAEYTLADQSRELALELIGGAK